MTKCKRLNGPLADDQENDRQLRAWRAWRNDRVRALLAGRYGDAVRELLRTLKELPAPKVLWTQLEAGPWRAADADTRYEILCLVDHAIIKHRGMQGLLPFNDPVPGQPDNLFLRLRDLLADAS